MSEQAPEAIPMPFTLQQRFAELNRLLCEHRAYWQLRSFESLEIPWRTRSLQAWLAQLSDQQRHDLSSDDALRADALQPFIPEALRLQQLCQLAAATTRATAVAPNRFSNHIPGRKWSQILAFDRAIQSDTLPFIEWCAGKGHLGRLLAYQHQQSVLSLELQPQLCEHGQQLADKDQLPCRYHPIDVMSESAAALLQPEQHAVALHACGKLHIRLLLAGTAQGVQRFSISPCCYHLIDEPHYPPLSYVGQASKLQLSRYDLKLAVQETVTAGYRERRLGQRELRWRLGFDLLQRQLRGIDEYLNCPTVPHSRLAGSFSEYCEWMAERKQIHLPQGIDYSSFEEQGEQRVIQVEQRELVRALFKRPLELWLVLDRALFLEEQGYRVQLQQFCNRELTPRNLLIQGHKKTD